MDRDVPSPPGGHVVLLGMMGAGKTTVGELLAARTGWPYVDNDRLLAQLEGAPTPDLARTEGAEELHRQEAAALLHALSGPGPSILGAAASVVEAAVDVALAGTFVVYLRADIETLVQRVGSGEGRPWLEPDPEAALRRLFEGRGPRYLALADLVVDVDGDRPDLVVEAVLDGLRADPRTAPAATRQPD